MIFHPFSFLWSCKWSKGDTFSNIFQMYINKCKRLGATVVVFDSYEASTKDATHNVRSGKMSKAVKIITENSCSFDCAEFLINYANKQRFVNDLQEALRLKEFEMCFVFLMLTMPLSELHWRPRVSKTRYWQMTHSFSPFASCIFFQQ